MDAKRHQNLAQRWTHLLKQRTFLLSCLGLAAIGMVLSGASRGFGEGEKKEDSAAKTKTDPGLRGLLIEEVPDALVEEEFDRLGKDLSAWSKQVAANLVKLYEDETLDAAGQRKVLDSLQKQLQSLRKAGQQTDDQSLKDNIAEIYGRIHRRVDVAQAALDTLAADPADSKQQRVQSAGEDVLAAIKELESFLGSYQNGSIWLGYLNTAGIKKAIQDGKTSDPALKNAQTKLANRVRLKNKVQREFLEQSAFLNLESALKALEVALAAPVKKVNMPALRAELKKLFTAIEKYESTNSVVASAEIRSAFDKIRGLAADGGERLSDAMRSHYVNYNFRLYISESFLNKLVDETRVDKSPVRDNVLGASVSGTQTTTAKISVDLKPSRGSALLDLVLSGVTRTSTAGTTSQATIYTSGYHTFAARQGLRFDGDQFSLAGRARMSVNANNTTTGASTKMSRVPILGAFANSIAVNAARKKRGQSEAIAARKLRDRVLPEFKAEIAKTVTKANKEMKEKVLQKLEDAGLMPESRSVRTTDHYLLLSARVMSSSELGGALTNPTERPGAGLTIRMHESLLNNAVDKLNFAGRKMTSDEIKEEVRKSLSEFLGSDYDKNAAETAPQPKGKKAASKDKFVFDSSDPIRLRIRNGELNVVIRCGLEQEGEDPIPTQIITVPLKISVTKEGVSIVRGTVLVAPAATPKNRAKQIIRAGVMRKKIESAIDNETRKSTLTFEREGKKPIVVTLTGLKTVNGWLTVWAK